MKRVACLVALAIAACASPPDTPRKVCTDTAEVAAKAGERCGFDKETTRRNFIAEAAEGSCGNVLSIRDENALRTQCFPWLEKASCGELEFSGATQSRFDPSCLHQLILGVVDAGHD